MNQAEYRIRTTEELLASSPCDREVYKTYIASQKQQGETEDEITTLPEKEITGWSVFHSDDKGLFVFDYHIKGFLKESGRNITGKEITALISKIDRFVFVSPRRIYFKRSGEYIAKPDATLKRGAPELITKPDGVKERPLRAMTMQGPRVSLKRSDTLLPGVELNFTVSILPLGKEITQGHIAKWLEYGRLCGLGEWRNGGFGRFEPIPVSGNGDAG